MKMEIILVDFLVDDTVVHIMFSTASLRIKWYYDSE